MGKIKNKKKSLTPLTSICLLAVFLENDSCRSAAVRRPLTHGGALVRPRGGDTARKCHRAHARAAWIRRGEGHGDPDLSARGPRGHHGPCGRGRFPSVLTPHARRSDFQQRGHIRLSVPVTSSPVPRPFQATVTPRQCPTCSPSWSSVSTRASGQRSLLSTTHS